LTNKNSSSLFHPTLVVNLLICLFFLKKKKTPSPEHENKAHLNNPHHKKTPPAQNAKSMRSVRISTAIIVNGTKKSRNPNGAISPTQIILRHPLNPTIDPVTGIITPEEIDDHGVVDEGVDE